MKVFLPSLMPYVYHDCQGSCSLWSVKHPEWWHIKFSDSCLLPCQTGKMINYLLALKTPPYIKLHFPHLVGQPKSHFQEQRITWEERHDPIMCLKEKNWEYIAHSTNDGYYTKFFPKGLGSEYIALTLSHIGKTKTMCMYQG